MTTPLYWLLVERSNTIDKGWVEGVRKAWKSWFMHAKSLRPYEIHDGHDFANDWDLDKKHKAFELVQREAKRGRGVLEQGLAFVERLAQDITINKGLWSSGKKDDAGDEVIFQIKEKVFSHLDAAKTALKEGLSMIDTYVDMANPARAPLYHAAWYDTVKTFQLVLNSPIVTANEAAQKADSEISGKLFRHLTKVTQMAGGTIDFGSHEPDELSIGKMKVIFLDTPQTERERQQFKGGRDPYGRKAYIRELKSAYALLARQKLAFLWTGLMYVRPTAFAPENNLGVEFGVGATYHRNGDFVTVYSNPRNGLDRLIVHELGHRYYYKYLSAQDRRNFDKWFGKVAATSAYGATISPEDFAEVFADFVIGSSLTRDQIDRFKAVLGRTHRLEDLIGTLKRLL